MNDGRVVTATVLFTDLVESTAQRSDLGDDAADDVAEVHDRMIRAVVGAHRGTIVKSTGDGVMAVFDAASDGVAAAMAIQTAAEQHNRTVDPRRHLVLRIGLSVGDVNFMTHDCRGTAVVEAARLESVAEAGQILVSENVRAIVGSRGGHRFEVVGTFDLKGLPGPVLAHRVLRDGPSSESGAETTLGSSHQSLDGRPRVALMQVPLPNRLDARAPFVGRVRERASLDRALDAVDTDGSRRVVLVAGEPGIGKTSLAADFARAAFARGAIVLYGRCDEDLGIPYQPWAEAIEHLAVHASDLVPTDEVAARGGDLRRLLAGVTPDLPVPALQQSEPDAERFLLYGAVLNLLVRASEQAPVLLVLDDLHWADNPSLLLLKHVVGAAEAARVLVLATYRDTDVTPDHPLAGVIVSLFRQPGVDRIALGGLDGDAVLALLESRAGHELGADGRVLRDALLHETDGNPFFVTETLRYLAESGAIRRLEDGRWVATTDLRDVGLPATVREVVQHRVAWLGADVQGVLRLAAVIGRDFGVGLLARAADATEESVLDAVEAAGVAALVRPIPGAPDDFMFTHALVEHTLYDGLNPARRRRAHRRVAEALGAISGDDPGDRVGELANHWLAADPAGPEALHYVRAAGERALLGFAPQEAVRWFEESIRLFDARSDVDQRERCAVLVALGEAQRHAGDGRSRETLLDAAELARRLGDDDLLVTAALANTRGWASSAGTVDRERVVVLESALEVVGHEPTAKRARLLATLSVEVSYDDDWRRRLELTDEALAIARQLDDDDTLSYVLARRHNAIQIPDQLGERLANTAENVAIAERLANPIARFWAAHYRMLDVLMAGRIDEVDTHLATVEELADRYGLPIMRYEAEIQRAWRDLLAGDLESAEAHARAGLAVGTESSQPDAVAVFAAQLFLVRLDQGRLEEIDGVLADAVARYPGIVGMRASLALAHCELGHDDDARLMLDAEKADGLESVPYDQLWLVTLTQWAMVSERLGDSDAATITYDLLAPWHDQIAFTGAHVFGSVELPLALSAATTKRYDVAEAHFAAALSAHEELGAPVWSARTRLGWARMLLARRGPGDADRAHELAAAALGPARELACRAVAAEAARMAGAV